MEARIMSKEALKAINDAMPSDAKYGDVFKIIAEKQDAISFKAGRESMLRESQRLIDFAYKVAKVMDDLKSSNVFFILQQALGDDMAWDEVQEILTVVIEDIEQGQAFLKGLEGDKKIELPQDFPPEDLPC
jgi:hypothetical protein